MAFRSFTELISIINLTKTFKEECIIKKLWLHEDESACNGNINIDNINLKDEAVKLFMRNNFESLSNKPILKNYMNENVFNLDTTLFVNSENLTEQFPENDEYNLNAYIRINSKLISEVNHFETQLKNLNSEQTEIINYIKENFDSQMLMFLSGEGGCGKSYLLNVIHIMLSGLNVQKLATTGNAASLIDGQTVHDFFLLTIN